MWMFFSIKISFFFCSTVFRAIQRNARTWSARTTGRGSQGNRLPCLRWFVVHNWSVTSGWWRSPCNVSKIIFWSPWTKREQTNYFLSQCFILIYEWCDGIYVDLLWFDNINQNVHTYKHFWNKSFWWYISCIFMYVKCRNYCTIHDIEMEINLY